MSLVKRSGIYLGSNILNSLVPFLLLPILTRYLSTSEYGQIAMFQTLVTGLCALVGLNTIGAANRAFYEQNKIKFDQYNGACLQILLFSLGGLSLVYVFFSGHLAELLSIPSEWIFISLFVAGATFIIQLRLGQWQVREEVVKFGAMQVSQSIVSFIISVFLVVAIQFGALGRIYAIVGTTAVYSIISLLLLYKSKLIKLTIFRKDYISDALKFGIPLLPHTIGIFFLSSLDRFIINKELGVSSAGIYMFAVQLSLGVAVFFDAVNKALITWLFKNLAENKVKELQRLVRFTYLFFFVVFLLGCLSFIIGPIVVNLIGGERFSEATEIIGWLCLGQCFGGMYLMVTNYLFYAKKTGRLSVVTVCCSIFNVFLLFFLIRVHGIEGVAIAFCLSMCIRFLATWWLTSKLNLVSWNVFQNKQ